MIINPNVTRILFLIAYKLIAIIDSRKNKFSNVKNPLLKLR